MDARCWELNPAKKGHARFLFMLKLAAIKKAARIPTMYVFKYNLLNMYNATRMCVFRVDFLRKARKNARN